MHTLEMQVRDANRREEVLKTEVERHRLRVESKLDVKNKDVQVCKNTLTV